MKNIRISGKEEAPEGTWKFADLRSRGVQVSSGISSQLAGA